MNSLSQIVPSYERGFKDKIVPIREAAKKVYTVNEFNEFKEKFTREEFLVAYVSIVAGIVEARISADFQTKQDLFSEIVTNSKIGLNKAFDGFTPDGHTLSCKECGKMSVEIYESNTFYELEGKRFHNGDHGEIVLKCFNSWVMDHIYFRIKGGYDKDRRKRTQFKEYSCPDCQRYTIEKNANDNEEILICSFCTQETGIITQFSKKNIHIEDENGLKIPEALKERGSFYNSEVLSLSGSIGNSEKDKEITLHDLVYSKESPELHVLQSRLKDAVEDIKDAIAEKWTSKKTGIFRDPSREAEMFDFLVPGDVIYSEEDIDQMDEAEYRRKIDRSNRSLGLKIAEEAGYSYPYAVCLDCGRKFSLGKNWKRKFERLKKEGCFFAESAIEHTTVWSDGAYDVVEAKNNLAFQYRIGYERSVIAGSNSGSTTVFEETGIDKHNKQVLSNYDERRIHGFNLEVRSHKNGFSDIGDWANTLLPENYKGKKEHITEYMHQVTNRWMGKLRNSCPECKEKLEELEVKLAGQGDFTCLSCDYTWKLREGEFLKRIKSDVYTKNLYLKYLNLLKDLLLLRREMRNPVVDLQNPCFGV